MMVFTAAQRAAIAENDPTWLLKMWIRAALTALILIPLGCFAYVVGFASNFQSPAFRSDTGVWPCILLIVLSLIWNLVTVAVYTNWKRPLNPLIQLLVHGLSALLFLIVGAVATNNAARASRLLGDDPYIPASGTNAALTPEGHTIKADNGSMVVVNSKNYKSCPAFTDCSAQADWQRNVQHRAGVAVAGCVFFFLVMLVHLLLTVLFFRDYQARRLETQLGNGSTDAFHLKTALPGSQGLQLPYVGREVLEEGTTSQVNLLRDGRGGLGFHKPHHATDSVLSVATSEATNQGRPSTANTAVTARSRPRFMRPKSNGPGLPLSFPLSRSGSKASTIASRSRSNASTIASKRRRSADTTKVLPPVPMIDTSMLRVSTADSIPPLTPDTNILDRSPISPPPSAALSGAFPGSISPQDAGNPERPRTADRTIRRKPPPPPLAKLTTSTVSALPQDNSKSPLPMVSPISVSMSRSFKTTAEPSPVTTLRSPTAPPPKISFEGHASNTRDPFSSEDFDHDQLSALPAMPPEGFHRMSRDTSRPTSPIGGLGDLDMLRSLRNTLFASDADTPRSRSSYASGAASNGRSSPFGRSQSPTSFRTGHSGRQSPWTARKERRELLREIEREREQREKELLEAEQKAHRAAEKMESAYLREEMKSADEKAALRKKRIEDRIQKLKDTLEELKRVQDEEERRAEERAERERKEEEEFQQEMAKYGKVVAARVVEHQRQESEAKSVAASHTVAGSRPTTRGGGDGSQTRPTTRGTDTRPTTSEGKGKAKTSGETVVTDKALPPVPPLESAAEHTESKVRYSWETGRTVAHTRKGAPG